MSPAALIALAILVACGGAHLEAVTIPTTTEAFTVFPFTQTVNAFIWQPTIPAAGKPWVWHAITLKPRAGGGGLPDSNEQGFYFPAWVAAGITIAGVDVGESMGSPPGREIFTKFYQEMVAAGFSRTPLLLARSRGGLQHYGWAADNPHLVCAFAGIFPVADMADYPGIAPPNSDMTNPVYGWGSVGLYTQAQFEAALPTINPVNRLASIAAANVPIYLIHGDADTVVHLAENSQLVATRYAALGGQITLEIIPGADHGTPSEPFFENTTFRDWVIAHAR